MIEKITSIDSLNQLADSGNLSGVYWVNENDYHKGPGISSTDLKYLLKSPAHYVRHKNSDIDSKSMMLGRAVHAAVLEPDSFADRYRIAEKIDRRTNEGKARQAEVDAMTGVTWLNQEDHDTVSDIAGALHSNKKFMAALNGASCELSVYWVDDDTGVLCKARADIINNGVIYDLKTTTDASESAFLRQALNYKYHLSAAWYLHGFCKAGLSVQNFAWFAVEKEPPQGIKIYSASERLLEVGLQEAKLGLKAYANARTTGVWQNYDDTVKELRLPIYYNFEGMDA